jgi:hypothetical protein
MTYFLDLRAESCGGSPADDVTVRFGDQMIDVADLVDLVRGRDVLLGTHGFNVNRENGIASLTSWETKLQLGSALFIGVLWPGDAKLPIFIDYPCEGDEAIRSGKLLGPFLDKYLADVASLSFVSHSLGARMVLETIAQMNPNRVVRRLVLMAGAIEDNCLTSEYQNSAEKVERISVLASRGDWVLKFAFPPGNLVRGIISRDHPYWSSALGREGPAPVRNNIAANWQMPDAWGYGHLDYLRNQLGPPLPLPVALPPGDPAVVDIPERPDDVSAWSAGFVSTRFE